ncbi:BAG-associated GRAM protein 1-like [Curcuma longa]|uniref:BAG-associated GRAM protein 1-like n=1 Tax=Curcuma longa TaxID=136217 RepID=UPI003D9F31DC
MDDPSRPVVFTVTQEQLNQAVAAAVQSMREQFPSPVVPDQPLPTVPGQPSRIPTRSAEVPQVPPRPYTTPMEVHRVPSAHLAQDVDHFGLSMASATNQTPPRDPPSRQGSLGCEGSDPVGPWHVSEEYDGWVREITLRSVCHSPMCPPDTALTEWQHAVLSPNKGTLEFETVQQVHDVPFGSSFEVHCKWLLKTASNSSCMLDIRVGAHFKRWCIMQSKIKSGAVDEYKKEAALMLEVARAYLAKVSSPS